ncbi:hypothetical protein SSS_07646 [Sarcoptes scabiei]|nr:hypothetical protein SSS_07646 [Sarcoptes scabiei]
MISPWKNCKDRQKFLKESINHKKFDYDNETNLENDQEDWKNSTPTKYQLTVRQKEKIEKQEYIKHYHEMIAEGHFENKNDEYKDQQFYDLARLDIIRKHRDEANQLREIERKAKEAIKITPKKKIGPKNGTNSKRSLSSSLSKAEKLEKN